MAYTRKITAQQRAIALHYRKEFHKSYRKIARKCDMSASTVARICRGEKKKKSSAEVKRKRGGPRKIDERCVRKLIRYIRNSRKTNPNVTVKTLVSESGLSLQMKRTSPVSHVKIIICLACCANLEFNCN